LIVGSLNSYQTFYSLSVERAHKEGIGYGKWQFEHMFAFAPASAYVGKCLESFKEFPPRQKPGTFSLDRVMEAITKGAGDK
jgi:hypothetical protein